MAKRIEMGGRVHEFPDDFTDADISSALASEPYSPPEGSPAARLFNNPKAMEEDAQKARQASAQESNPMARVAAGAGRFAFGLVPGERARNVRESFDQATKGDVPTTVGKLAPEILATMAGGSALSGAARVGSIARPAIQALARGGVEGAASAALHQAQNAADGKEANSAGGVAEIMGSAAIGGAGSKIGSWAEKAAPAILRSAIKPTLAAVDVPNPPNFELALEKNLVPYFGGLEKSRSLASKQVSELGNARDWLAKRAGAQGKKSIPALFGSLRDVARRMDREAALPKKQLLTGEAEQAKEAIGFWGKEILARSSASKSGEMSVQDALALRTKIDKEIDWRKVNQSNTPGFDRVSHLLRRKLEARIKEVDPRIYDKTKEMGKILPYEKALGRRNLQAGNNYKLGLMDLAAISAGGTAGLPGGLSAVPATAALAFGARRLTSTPGGAAMLYDAGRSLGRKSTLRNLGIQGARTIGNDQGSN